MRHTFLANDSNKIKIFIPFLLIEPSHEIWYLSHWRPAKAQVRLRGYHQSLRCSHT